jgi:hypothetical protein
MGVSSGNRREKQTNQKDRQHQAETNTISRKPEHFSSSFLVENDSDKRKIQQITPRLQLRGLVVQ